MHYTLSRTAVIYSTGMSSCSWAASRLNIVKNGLRSEVSNPYKGLRPSDPHSSDGLTMPRQTDSLSDVGQLVMRESVTVQRIQSASIRMCRAALHNTPA
jgi:hypothetical protein